MRQRVSRETTFLLGKNSDTLILVASTSTFYTGPLRMLSKFIHEHTLYVISILKDLVLGRLLNFSARRNRDINNVYLMRISRVWLSVDT